MLIILYKLAVMCSYLQTSLDQLHICMNIFQIKKTINEQIPVIMYRFT